ncbi:MAG: helix-turn-helix transcriptional regulator [Robiginitomaculum sp.]|nr:helix-turn-helix transcriptional regulator [Robiginitomaculum sp.]
MAKTRISNQIRTLRFFSDEMSQAALADKIGVTRQTVMAIEAAKYSPSLELAFKIAAVFGKELGEVFTYPKEPQND